MELQEIREEIISVIEKRHTGKPDIISKVNEELDLLEITDGLNGKNNLEAFYEIWQKNKNKVGDKNEINSWTAFAIGLTKSKPIDEFLPLRRAFARAGFPDIDTDFDDEKRDEIYQYIIEKYGRENVGNIGTHGLLKFKSCITRMVKVLDIADSYNKGKDAYITDNVKKVNEILSPFPKKGFLKVRDEHGETKIIKTAQDAYKYCTDFKYYMDQYPQIMRHIKDIEGNFANFGSHAAGIVISDVPLETIAPLRTARKGMLATQFTMEQLESIGLIKFDILSLLTLTVIKKAVKLIKENYDIDIDVENLKVNDDDTFALYRSGNLAGVFQCEQYGMRQTMRDIEVDNFDDIMAGISLFRPGPMDSIPEFCSRKKGMLTVDYFHPSIEKHVKPYLEKTYGILIYQEQIMQICNALAGFSIADGYIMIKAIGKKKIHLMNRFKKQFVKGCVDNGVPKDVAQQYWDKFIIPFASYGFNKSHACCYGYNSYITAYLKANYPDEFVCAFLSVEVERAHHDKVAELEKDFLKKLDITFLARDINKSKTNYFIERKKDFAGGVYKTEIRPTLLCKGIGFNAAKHIEENQPYANLKELAEKTSSSIIDSRVVYALAENGYFLNKKGKKTIEKISAEFVQIKNDLKLAAKKGVESVDIFG